MSLDSFWIQQWSSGEGHASSNNWRQSSWINTSWLLLPAGHTAARYFSRMILFHKSIQIGTSKKIGSLCVQWVSTVGSVVCFFFFFFFLFSFVITQHRHARGPRQQETAGICGQPLFSLGLVCKTVLVLSSVICHLLVHNSNALFWGRFPWLLSHDIPHIGESGSSHL